MTNINFKSIEETLSQSVSKNFWVTCENDTIEHGNKDSF